MKMYKLIFFALFFNFSIEAMEQENQQTENADQKNIVIKIKRLHGEMVEYRMSEERAYQIPLIRMFLGRPFQESSEAEIVFRNDDIVINTQIFDLIFQLLLYNQENKLDSLSLRQILGPVSQENIIDLIKTANYLGIPDDYPNVLPALIKYLCLKDRIIDIDNEFTILDSLKDMNLEVSEQDYSGELPDIKNGKELDLSNLLLTHIKRPLPSVGKLNLKNNNFYSLQIENLPKKLQFLYLSKNQLNSLPDLRIFSHLRTLDVSCNKVKFPEIIKLPDCEFYTLDFSANGIDIFPCNFSPNGRDNWRSKVVRFLKLAHNNLSTIKFDHMPYQIEELDLSHNQIKDLPSINGVENYPLPNLWLLNLSDNQLSAVDGDQIPNPSQYFCLYLSRNNINRVNLSLLSFLKHLHLDHNQLTEISGDMLPRKIIDKNGPKKLTAKGRERYAQIKAAERFRGDNFSDEMEFEEITQEEVVRLNWPKPPIVQEPLKINLAHNHIKKVRNLKLNHQITGINVSHNDLTELSSSDLPEYLESLDVSHNPLQKLDLSSMPYIESLTMNDTDLKELNLSNNDLTKLPENIKNMNKLVKLNISGNQFIELSNQDLPKKIEELIISDNPLNKLDISGLQNLKILKLENTNLSESDKSILLATIGPKSDWQNGNYKSVMKNRLSMLAILTTTAIAGSIYKLYRWHKKKKLLKTQAVASS